MKNTTSTENIIKLVKRVKRGVRLLDKKVPGWRKTLKTHTRTFDIGRANYCVLGTLEHYNARMKALNKKRVVGQSFPDYYRATVRLNFATGAASYGFNGDESSRGVLQQLWRAEFDDAFINKDV